MPWCCHWYSSQLVYLLGFAASGWVLFWGFGKYMENKYEGWSQQPRKRETLPIVCLLQILSAQFQPFEGSLAIAAAG